jgi:hypothetical protein
MRGTRMKRLALLPSLLALGALGLVACGGGDDDQTTAASGTRPTQGEPAADNKSCGSFGRSRLAVVGGVPCDVARNVMRVYGVQERNPGFWKCYGSEANPVCINEAHGLNETVGDPSSEVIVGWCCGVSQRRAYIHAADQLAVGVPDHAVLEAIRHHVELLRTVTIVDDEDGAVFHGHVKFYRDACVKHRKVKLFKERKGQVKLLGRDKTSRNGSWGIGSQWGNPLGNYHAKVKRSERDRDGTTLICRRAASRIVHIP